VVPNEQFVHKRYSTIDFSQNPKKEKKILKDDKNIYKIYILYYLDDSIYIQNMNNFT